MPKFSLCHRIRRVPMVLAAVAVFLSVPCLRAPALTPPQPMGAQVSAFLGAWCAQGDPRKHASITNSGAFLTLTNENGDTATGTLAGPNRITAQQWQFVTGTLSNGSSQIDWSNGTFWARCYGGGGGGDDGDRWHRPIRLTGTWLAMGQRNRQCHIEQHHGDLTLQNEAGQGATGSFTGRDEIVTNWSGTTIRGHIDRDGNRIDWDNGSYWVRDRLYTQ